MRAFHLLTLARIYVRCDTNLGELISVDVRLQVFVVNGFGTTIHQAIPCIAILAKYVSVTNFSIDVERSLWSAEKGRHDIRKGGWLSIDGHLVITAGWQHRRRYLKIIRRNRQNIGTY